MWKRLIWFLAAIPLMIWAQVTAAAPPFTADEIAIYRDFLLHYPQQLSNMIGMQDTTVPFEADMAFGDDPKPPGLEIPAYSGRKLPPEVTALTDEQAVTARIAAAGQLVEPRKRDPDAGPDGFLRMHFTLSEIAFDSKRELAVFVYSASCGCKGGSRGTVVYVLTKNREWSQKGPILNFWIS